MYDVVYIPNDYVSIIFSDLALLKYAVCTISIQPL